MGKTQPALSHHLDQVPKAKLVAQIPTDTQDDPFAVEVPSSKQLFDAAQLAHPWPSILQKANVPDRTPPDLHQNLSKNADVDTEHEVSYITQLVGSRSIGARPPVSQVPLAPDIPTEERSASPGCRKRQAVVPLFVSNTVSGARDLLGARGTPSTKTDET